jgi:hypothetical protein
MPLSADIKMSGATLLRWAAVIASTLICPLRAIGSSETIESIISCTWPAATSVKPGAVPR